MKTTTAITMALALIAIAPAACQGAGGSCVLMFVGAANASDRKYVWEIVSRDTGETVSTTGGVDATVTASGNNVPQTVRATADTAFTDMNCDTGYVWDASTSTCVVSNPGNDAI